MRGLQRGVASGQDVATTERTAPRPCAEHSRIALDFATPSCLSMRTRWRGARHIWRLALDGRLDSMTQGTFLNRVPQAMGAWIVITLLCVLAPSAVHAQEPQAPLRLTLVNVAGADGDRAYETITSVLRDTPSIEFIDGETQGEE